MSVSTCRCRREPRRLFSFRLNIWILCVSKKKWVLVLSVPWYFVYYWLTQCAGLWVCRELCNAWLGTAKWAVQELVYISYFFILWGKKPKKNYGIRGKKCDQEKDEFNKQPHGTWPHTLGSSYLELLPLPSPPVVLCKRFGSKKLVFWVSRCLPCFPVTHILFLALKEKTRLLDQYCNYVVISY